MRVTDGLPLFADGLFLLLALTVGVAYARGASRVWAADAALWPLRAKRARLPLWRVGLFAVGLGAVVLALNGPASAWAARVLALHVTQHHVVATLGAPLLVLGEPALVFGALLGARQRARLAAQGRRVRNGRWFRWTLGRPLAIWLGHVVVVWSGYHPTMSAVLQREAALHALYHLALLASAIAFWWLLIGPAITWLSVTRAQRAMAALGAWVQNNALSVLIAFGSLAASPQHTAGVQPWGLGPLEAQRVAGAAQYLPGEIVYLLALTLLAFAWLAGLDQPATKPEAHEPVAAAPLPDRTRLGLLARRKRMLRGEWEP